MCVPCAEMMGQVWRNEELQRLMQIEALYANYMQMHPGSLSLEPGARKPLVHVQWTKKRPEGELERGKQKRERPESPG